MKVRNMQSAKGNNIANQFIISGMEEIQMETGIGCFPEQVDVQYFQSYDSVIAKKIMKGVIEVYLDKTHWDCSVTTGKYRNLFLGETKAETQKKIDSGEYKLVDLN